MLTLQAFNYLAVLVLATLRVSFYTLYERKILSLSHIRKGPQIVSFRRVLQALAGLRFLISSVISNPGLCCVRLFVKLGLWPAFIWVAQVFVAQSFFILFLVGWLLKIPAIYALSLMPLGHRATIVIFLSVALGAVAPFSVSRVKLILGYRSLIHSSLVLVCLPWFVVYWVVYGALLLRVLSLFSKVYLISVSQAVRSLRIQYFAIAFGLTVLAGLPPFRGFLLKLIAVFRLFEVNPGLAICVLRVTAGAILYYLRLTLGVVLSMSLASRRLKYRGSMLILLRVCLIV